MLVLLIMLIITIPIQLHAVNLNMPVGTPPPTEIKPEIISIDIDDKSVVHWQGVPVAGRCRAREHDEERLPRSRRSRRSICARTVFAKYEVVANVLASTKRSGPHEDRRRRQRAVHRMSTRQAATIMDFDYRPRDPGRRFAGPRDRRRAACADRLCARVGPRAQGGRGDQEAARGDDHPGSENSAAAPTAAAARSGRPSRRRHRRYRRLPPPPSFRRPECRRRRSRRRRSSRPRRHRRRSRSSSSRHRHRVEAPKPSSRAATSASHVRRR